MLFPTVLTLLSALTFTLAAPKRIQITVGGNTTDEPSKVFDPQSVEAAVGDIVVFNFSIPGNHSAMQSLFPAPCIPAHDFNSSVNGFYSGFREGKAKTVLEFVVPNNETIWFFDWNTCALGGVGVINVNKSEENLETLDGFTRNALRLNGSESESSSSSSSGSSPTSTGSQSSSSPTAPPNNAAHALDLGFKLAMPMMMLAIFLQL